MRLNEVAEFLGKRVFHRWQRLDGGPHEIQSGGALITFCPSGERMTAQVAGQADP
jgi:hypothetical protein